MMPAMAEYVKTRFGLWAREHGSALLFSVASLIAIGFAVFYFSSKEASSFEAPAALSRLESPYHVKFSETTKLIRDKELKLALQKAIQLRQEIEAEAGNHALSEAARSASTLYLFNLLRIAMLEKEAGSPEGEKAAWQTLQQYGGKLESVPSFSLYDPEAFPFLEQYFQAGEASLKDYMSQRLKALN
jgi:hypothetical protein